MGILIDDFAVPAEDALPALSSVSGPGRPGSSMTNVASVGIQPVPDLEGMVSRLPTADGDGEIEILGESGS